MADAYDEIADLKKANALLHGFLTNREAEIERLRAALDEADALLGDTLGTSVIGDEPYPYPAGSDREKAVHSFLLRCVDRGSEQSAGQTK